MTQKNKILPPNPMFKIEMLYLQYWQNLMISLHINVINASMIEVLKEI